MKSFKSQFAFLAVMLLAGSAVSMFAQNTTVLKVHTQSALAVPGKVLQPGNYVFRIADSPSGPYNVQIMSADGKTSIGFIPVYNTQRNTSSDNSAVLTVPDESGLLRVDSWFLPGSHDGFRFIYSKSDLRKIDMIAQQMQQAAKGVAAD